MTDTTRREYMAGVAALAAARWETEDYDIENVENWEPMKHGTYTTGTFSPGYFSTSGEGKVGGWLLEDEDLSERTLEVFYDTQEVHLTMEGKAMMFVVADWLPSIPTKRETSRRRCTKPPRNSTGVGRWPMQTTDARMTARIVRTDGGETYREYRVGGVSYPSAEAVQAALETR